MIVPVGCQLALASWVRNSRATEVRIGGVAVIASRKPLDDLLGGGALLRPRAG